MLLSTPKSSKNRNSIFNGEMLRPYFKMENVMKGLFIIAEKLYGYKFNKTVVPVY
ncbi:MAG: hypothetical protein K8S56_06910, partial [Candidatus Cloacimonetes bacterium]|nr:hypothetical protein [Candidatus Cloacimonadota bacterium]